MVFAIVIYGCFLGWFRFFRLSNLFHSIRSFSSQGEYSAFSGFLYIALYALCILLLFRADIFISGADTADNQAFLGLKASLSNLSYFVSGVVFAEICRIIIEVEGDTNVQVEPKGNFMELLKTLSFNYHVEGDYSSVLGYETCKAIEVSAWLYGTRSDVKRSLILAISKEFGVPHYYRSEVLDYFNFQSGKNQPAQKALKFLVRKNGKGSAGNINFLEKIAKIGRRSGFDVSEVRNSLNSVGNILGIPEDIIQSTLKRAERTSTDHDWRDFSSDSFWAERYSRQQSQEQRYSQKKTYTQQDYARSNSSRESQSSSSLSERQTFLTALGLAEGAVEKDIRSAYRKLAMKYHPDRVQADGGTEADVEEATEKMSVINRAYDWLCDNPA